MRVLHIGKYYPPFAGGMEVFARDLCEALADDGHEVRALVHAHQGIQPGIEQLGRVAVERTRVITELVFTPISPGFPLTLGRCLRQFRPEILHFHLPNPSAFWALTLPAARKLPWIVHWHSDVVTSPQQRGLRLAYPVYRPWEQAMLRRAARIIVTSPDYRATSVPLRKHLDRCATIPLGLDRRRLGAPAAQQLPWPDRHLRLLTVGRLTYYKGLTTLIRAIADLPDVGLVIVGSGREGDSIQAEIAALELQDRVTVLHGVGDVQRDQLLAACDVYCLPSIERTEAFGMVLLEAMAFGRPLVVSDIAGSGAPWLVRETGSGLLARPGDAADLASVIRRLAEDPGLRAELGQRGQQAFAERFEISQVAAATADLYHAVRSERR